MEGREFHSGLTRQKTHVGRLHLQEAHDTRGETRLGPVVAQFLDPGPGGGVDAA